MRNAIARFHYKLCPILLLRDHGGFVNPNPLMTLGLLKHHYIVLLPLLFKIAVSNIVYEGFSFFRLSFCPGRMHERINP